MRSYIIIAAAICVLFGTTAEARHYRKHHHHVYHVSNSSNVIGGRPSGCPRAFCGCGASLRIFGRIIPRLNASSNWLGFPRTSPRPGMAAVRRGHALRRGHVFVLERHISGQIWLVHDSNSGGHRTRLHPRSISGYVIVDPSRG